ncbi:MAG: hypothetical protein MZW92_68050 [Comamonadaceae bacterium]|nr:hypothetical protein [Comamonadaceae bacterium]
MSHGTVCGCVTEQGVPMAGLDHEFTTGALFDAQASAFYSGTSWLPGLARGRAPARCRIDRAPALRRGGRKGLHRLARGRARRALRFSSPRRRDGCCIWTSTASPTSRR